MNIFPHHIAAVLLVGGLSIGGYFGISALIPSSLASHLNTLGVELLSSNWAEKENNYKSESAENLISSISKESGKENIVDFANKLEKWCKKYEGKYFLGENDANYKRFSLWCTKTENVGVILTRRGLKTLTEEEKTKKFESYKSSNNTDKFILKAITNQAELSKEDLNKWCTEKNVISYKYESDPDLKRVIKWCYKN